MLAGDGAHVATSPSDEAHPLQHLMLDFKMLDPIETLCSSRWCSQQLNSSSSDWRHASSNACSTLQESAGLRSLRCGRRKMFFLAAFSRRSA